jgi:hypothetical protein
MENSRDSSTSSTPATPLIVGGLFGVMGVMKALMKSGGAASFGGMELRLPSGVKTAPSFSLSHPMSPTLVDRPAVAGHERDCKGRQGVVTSSGGVCVRAFLIERNRCTCEYVFLLNK